ncbi:sulfatase-like hydrolase/transferase [Aestuariibaculum sediminum]|uniref:Sulfatase-like hydrolase/transferase n=1 Tax=Aestuariibaculum sediminum TaxID=2770637 RepID=A0A8J6U6T9_9FLAO|nr:sulfatase-like hydrolase/transferase [Aestuariibaculum sediminum]MBD0831000.1 sulfatase-like hydrolase/transferase [Aestuariibaculum sediminum]
MIKKLFFYLLTYSLLIHFSCQESQSTSSKNKPNILLIMADDLGWFDTGFNGNNELQTPHLDALAAKGIILNRFYSASTVCSPTRASVLTGRNPFRMHIPDANTGHMLHEEITIAELLKKHNYATGHFGKWHLGTLTRSVSDANRGGNPDFHNDYSLPTEHGYDEFFCTESKVPTFDPMFFPTHFSEDESKRYGWKAIKNKDSVQNYGTAYWIGQDKKAINNLEGDDSKIIMDRLIPFIEKAHQNSIPFFSTVWLHTPHLPVVSDSLHRSKYDHLPLDKQLYYGAISAMDEQIGRLWKNLEELNITENTILFFCSDNGPELNTPGSSGIYQGAKRSLSEGGVRVPAFAVWNEHFNAVKTTDVPCNTSDYLPTILNILGDTYPDERPLDGINILNVLKGKTKERKKPMGFLYKEKMSWVTQQFKLISRDNGKHFELYDLLHDPSETVNIYSRNPNLAKRMETELNTWLKSIEKSKAGEDY